MRKIRPTLMNGPGYRGGRARNAGTSAGAEDVSTFGGHAYDAFIVLARGLKDAGTGADKEKVRTAIENIKGLVGTAGVFNFSATDHNGLDQSAFEMLTVKDGKFAVYEK